MFIRLITPLGLTRQFQIYSFNILLLKEAEIIIVKY